VLTRVVSTFVRSCLVALVVACADNDAPTAAIPREIIERVSGDGQVAPPGSVLDRPLVARIHDRRGWPVRQAKVQWFADAGHITPLSGSTDSSGIATAVWELGTQAGPQHATVYAAGSDSVGFVAFVDGAALPDRIPLRALNLITYDASGEVVHPDVAVGPFDGLDDATRLVITPYPGGNPGFENPSLYVRDPRTGWAVPKGVMNPLVRPANGYLSDPDILWLDDQREFRLFYRQVDKENELLMIRSSDGVSWSQPITVLRAPNHEAVSPSVVRRAPGEWLMWTVNAGAAGCVSRSTTVELRRSADGETWSAPTTVTLSQDDLMPWHIEVQWVPSLGEYWAMFNAKQTGSCTTEALYLATSPDGLTWRTYQAPVLRRGAIPEFSEVVYRATFAYDSLRDAVSIWHSGARFAMRYEWHAAFERMRRGDLIGRVNRPDAAVRVPSSAPPLTNATAP
jgi:hypothetical protein